MTEIVFAKVPWLIGLLLTLFCGWLIGPTWAWIDGYLIGTVWTMAAAVFGSLHAKDGDERG